MADDQESSSGGIPGLMEEFFAQLRGATEKLQDLTGLGDSAPSMSLPGLPPWPSPGAFSAAQLSAITAGVAAQRRSIEALKAQLIAFDEQLAVLEGMLEPLAQWSRTWAELEDRLTRQGRQPGGAAPDEPSA